MEAHVPLVPPPHAQYALHPPQHQDGPTPQQPPLVPPHNDQDGPYVKPPPADPLPQPGQHTQGVSPQASSLCQPQPPVPHGQQLPCMVASPPSALPEGPGPGAEQISVPQTMSKLRKDLGVVIHTAGSLNALADSWKGMRVPNAITKKLTVAVASLNEVKQMLERWMQGPDGEDPVEAAREGRLECLQRLHKEGRFLDLYSPDRAAAGEARRAEVWLAALAACKAGHAHVLRWLFQGGWPHSFDVEPPWHLRDMAESWIKQFETVTQQYLLRRPDTECPDAQWRAEVTCALPELELYCSAMRAPACLEALLEAGARSPWICRVAVLKGRADLLRLAVARTCPCDEECLFFAALDGQVAVLEEILGMDCLFNGCRVDGLALEAGILAAARGQEACLEALLRWHPDLLCGSSAVAHAAARAGSLNCLKLLHRAGFKEWRGTTHAAAGRPDNLPCLLFALQLDPPSAYSRGELLKYAAMEKAAWAGSLTALNILHEAGCRWTGREVEFAICSGSLDVVVFCLRHGVEGEMFDWSKAMSHATEKGGRQMMKLLYEAGFPPDCMSGKDHPALLAIQAGKLEATQTAVKYSGVPELQWLDTKDAARGGEALLRYVHGLAGTLGEDTAKAAAEKGQLGALRYAIESGAPWDRRTLVAAVEGDSLDCLKYAHEGGCPLHTLVWLPDFPAARSLPVLRYICERMGPTWSAGVLHETAERLAHYFCEAGQGLNFKWQMEADYSLNWQMALYTAQQFENSKEPQVQCLDPPAPLAAAVLVRRERAAALAGAFFKAGQLAQVWAAHPWAPIWRSMAGLPSELLHRIAFMAHLVLPPPPVST